MTAYPNLGEKDFKNHGATRFIFITSHKKYMKRGRPSLRKNVSELIIKQLGSAQTPMTISALSRTVSKEFGSVISWNTVRKYIRELQEVGKIEAIALPHSKEEGKSGLTVYILKK